jgi:hypothetical protein
VRIPLWAYNKTVGRLLPQKAVDGEGEYQDDEVPVSSSSSGADDFEVLEKTKTTAENGDNVLRRKKSAKGR